MSDTDETPQSVPQSAAVVALYDAAIGHIRKAAKGAGSGNYETQVTEIMAAVRIFTGLDGCLDMSAGGQVAANLRDMYVSVARALVNTVGQPDGQETCLKLIDAVSRTRDAWAKIAGVAVTAAAPQA